MATVNDFKAMSDEAIAKRIADLQAAQQAVPAAAAAKPAASVAARNVQIPQLNLAQYLQANQQKMNSTNLASLLQRLSGRGSLMGGQANLGINPMTGRPANYGDYSKAPIQRLFGGVDEPNLADKIAYLAGGKIFVPANNPMTAPVQDPYVNRTFPDDGVTYAGLNPGPGGGEGYLENPIIDPNLGSSIDLDELMNFGEDPLWEI